MPIFNIKVAQGDDTTPEECKKLYTEVAEKIAEIHKCPIEAVSGSVEILPPYSMGQGDSDWATRLEKEDESAKRID